MPVFDKVRKIGFGEGAVPFIDDGNSSFSSLNDNRFVMFPGFCDVHVHFREPGFSYKETIASGCRAAARGGYTAVCTMPNLDPVPDSVGHLREQTAIIARDARIAVCPYAAITVGEAGSELADLEALAPFVVAFSDDGHGVQDRGLMREAMQRAKALGKLIVAHCEDNSLLRPRRRYRSKWSPYKKNPARENAHAHHKNRETLRIHFC